MIFLALCLSVAAAPAEPADPASPPRLQFSAAKPLTGPPAAEGPTVHCPQASGVVTIDGNLREWGGVPVLTLDRNSVVSIRDYGGDRDCSAKVQLQWDRYYLYLAAEVTDDEHVQRHGDGFLFHDDCLMVGFDGLDDATEAALDDDDYVYGFCLSDWDEEVWRYAAPSVVGRRAARSIVLDCRRYGHATYYEAALPWSELAPLTPVAQSRCGFSVLVGDRDSGTDRRETEYVAWTPGLAEPRDPRRFGTLVFDTTAPGATEAPDFFPQLPRTVVDIGHDARATVGVLAGEPFSVRMVAALSREDERVAFLSQQLDLPKGASRFEVSCALGGLPEGAYRLMLAAYRTDDWQWKRVLLPFVRYDSRRILGEFEALAKQGVGVEPSQWAEVRLRLETGRELLRQGVRAGMTAATLEEIRDLREEARELAGQPRHGQAALDGRVGWVARAYYSPVDDSVQPYLMYVPDDYDRSRPYPLVVSLHYLTPDLTKEAWVNRARQQSWVTEPVAYSTRPPMLELRPFGRGNNWYRGLGEEDVLQALAHAKQHYNLDPDRVYLTGTSMGGTGAWYLAARHPDLFAAAATVSGHLEYAYNDEREFGDSIDPAWPRSFWQARSPYFLAANLLNLPLYCHHGKEDTIVPVYQSQAMVRELQKMKHPLKYEEYSHVGHSGFPSTLSEDLRRWFLDYRRLEKPTRAVVRTSTLAENQAYWLRIDRLDQMYRFGQVQAEVGANGIEAFAWNVREFTLLLDRCPLAPDREFSVSVMRQPVWTGAPPASRQLTLRRGEGEGGAWQVLPAGPTWQQPDAPLMKHHGLQGPLADIYNTPMVLVYGTQGDEQTTRLLQQEASVDRDRVNRWFAGNFQAIADTAVTDDVIAKRSLLLYGGPGENAVTARIADELPIHLDAAALVIGSRRLAGADWGAKFIYPNPLNPSRYVVVNLAVLPAALRGAGSIPWGLWDPLPDYVVFRARPAAAGHGTPTALTAWNAEPPAIVGEGMFDDAWQVVEDSPLVKWRLTK